MNEKSENLKNGYIYCLYNPMYNNNGNIIYKLGQTSNLSNRLSSYSTSYLEKSEFIITSENLLDKNLAEKLLFEELRKYRINNNREFFNCNIEVIKEAFVNVQNFFIENNTLEKILNYYNTKKEKNKKIKIEIKKIIKKEVIISDKIKNLLINIENPSEYEKRLISDNKYFEKYINLIQFLNNDNIIVSKNKITKIKICSELMKVLGIETFENFNKDLTKNFGKEVTSIWLEENMETIKRIFDIRGNKYNNTKYYTILLLNVYKL
jgi:hypothetical protein